MSKLPEELYSVLFRKNGRLCWAAGYRAVVEPEKKEHEAVIKPEEQEQGVIFESGRKLFIIRVTGLWWHNDAEPALEEIIPETSILLYSDDQFGDAWNRTIGRL